MRTRKAILSLCCALCLLLTLCVGCAETPATDVSEPAADASQATSDAEGSVSGDVSSAESADESTGSAGTTASTGSSGTSASAGGKTTASANGTTTTKKGTTAKTTLNNIPSTEEGKWGNVAGLTSTKKTPAWMKQIKDGKIVGLGLVGEKTGANDENYQLQKTVFKALTGKELLVDEVLVEWNSMRTTLQTMVFSGNGPDLFAVYNGVAVYLRNKNLTRDIKGYINMNDAAWEEMKPYSEMMFYKGELMGVPVAEPTFTYGVLYNKTLLNQAGLDDPYELFKQGKWDISTLLEYVEELTVDRNHDNTPEVFGITMAPECIFRMALSSGEDLVKINDDGSITNNLRSATFTRWASYARDITEIGSYDTESWTAGERFIQGKIAMVSSPMWSMFSNDEFIKMKKADKIGWVPSPADINSKTYYHVAEQQFYLMPKNSKNPDAAAAYLYTLRYMNLNPSAVATKEQKDRYINEYGWTEEEYTFSQNMSDYLTPITFNWQHIPDFSYTSLWNVFTEDWATLVEEVYPSLQSAIDAQNK